MAKFKVGQKYRVENVAFQTNGNLIEITDVWNTRASYRVIQGKCFGMTDFDFNSPFGKSLVRYYDDEITITRHGNKVVAKYCNKVGVAKCSPEDEFDFAIGAKLAFNRLMGFVEPTLESTNDKIKVGDKVRIIGNKFLMHYIPIGSLVNVREVNEHGNLFCMRKDLFGAATGQWVNPKDVEKVTDDAFDWSGFKAGKFFVKCTKDNFESFIAEAKKHDCRFVPDENFNPFATGAMCTVKLFMELSGLKTVDENEVLVIFSDEKLFVDVAIPSNKDIVTW